MIRAWLLDDEKLALQRLSRMLEATGKLQIAGCSSDPEEALVQLAASPVDALFLDIEMPGCSGFEFLRRLQCSPAIVFTTAYDRYAVKAFEADGTDYLLKPITPEALERAVSKLERGRVSGPAAYGEMISRLTAALSDARRRYPARVASRLGDRGQFVDLDKVTHFFAEGKLTYAVSAGRNLIVDESIVQLEAKLDPAQFFRIHRAYLVNLAVVAEVCTWFGGKMIVRLQDASRTELPIARDRLRDLKERLGF